MRHENTKQKNWQAGARTVSAFTYANDELGRRTARADYFKSDLIIKNSD
jgi:hypothetical protein